MMVTAILCVLLAALVAYAVFGGADFGAGVWEFNTAFRSSERERKQLLHAIGPIWETNHVWLIFILVLLFGAFPSAFASMNEALFVPLLLALTGIVFRGAAYAFSAQRPAGTAIRWRVAFALASVLAPLFLGVCVGAMASGEMQFDADGHFVGNHLSGWINSLSIFCGFFTVGLCAYTSATYMMRESVLSGDADLVDLWRTRALAVGTLMGVLALGGLLLAASRYPLLWQGLAGRGWPIILISMVSGVGSLRAIHRQRTNVAVIGVTVTCATVVIGWAVAQYPMLLPPYWTVTNSASPDSVLALILGVTGIGAMFLVPALVLLLKIFKS